MHYIPSLLKPYCQKKKSTKAVTVAVPFQKKHHCTFFIHKRCILVPLFHWLSYLSKQAQLNIPNFLFAKTDLHVSMKNKCHPAFSLTHDELCGTNNISNKYQTQTDRMSVEINCIFQNLDVFHNVSAIISASKNLLIFIYFCSA